MARPREFNEAQALDKAMDVFWKKGYQNTSLDDLLDAMGIQRGSFYNTFHSKRATYLRAINRYIEIMASGGPYTELALRQPGLATLQHMLEVYLESLCKEGECHGCFCAHVSKEHRGDDPEIKDVVLAGIDQMRGIIKTSMEAAQDSGDLPTAASSGDLALLFMSVAWGMHVLAEAGVPTTELKKAGAQLFKLSQSAA